MQFHKLKLKALADDLMSLDQEGSDDLFTTQHRLDDLFFECELIIRKLIGTETPRSTASSSDADHQGVKLPKLSAPTFDGKLTSWTSFWAQVNVTIHSRTTLSDVHKLTYLRNSLTEGTAKCIIDGLSGNHYADIIKTVRARLTDLHSSISHMSTQSRMPLGRRKVLVWRSASSMMWLNSTSTGSQVHGF